MVLQHFSEVGHIGSFLSLVLGIFGVLIGIVWFIQSIRRDPDDRVVRFQALAFVTLFLGALLLKEFAFWWPLDLIWLVLFFVLTGRAAYFGVRELLWRRKQRQA